MTSAIEIIKNAVKKYPDFPKPGIVFIDIFSVLKDVKAFRALQDVLTEHISQLEQVDAVAALESRGFLFGPQVAQYLGVPFIPIRKKGKLPGEVKQISYRLEYGMDVFEVQTDCLSSGKNVVVVDDLLATGGSLAASCQLLSDLGCKVVECLVVFEITDLKGRDRVGAPVHSVLQYTDN